MQKNKITLTPPQSIIFRDNTRFRVVAAGRRFGKTYLASSALLSNAVSKKGANVVYLAPTYGDAERIMWKMLIARTPRQWLASPPNKTKLKITLINGSEIKLMGVDREISVTGESVTFAVLDECRYFKSGNVWFESVRPALSDQKGGALFISSPSGYDWFYDLYNLGMSNDPDWSSYHFTTVDGGNVDQEEIDAARRTMPEKLFRQEYMASFENMAGRVYYAFDRKYNVSPVEYSGGEILAGMDFNVNPMSVTLCQRSGDQLHQFDEIIINDSNTEEACIEIKRKYPNSKVIVFPDPSGRARKTSAIDNTDFTIIQRYFQMYAPRSHSSVEDRFNTLNGLMCSADGTRRYFVDPRCVNTIKCLEGMSYKEGTKQPDKMQGFDHLPDSLGYLAMAEFPLFKKVIDTSLINWG